jgi:hypothetical protein
MTWTQFRVLGKSRPVRQSHNIRPSIPSMAKMKTGLRTHEATSVKQRKGRNFIFLMHAGDSTPVVRLCILPLPAKHFRIANVPIAVPYTPEVSTTYAAHDTHHNHQKRLPSSTLVMIFGKLLFQAIVLFGYFGMITSELKIVMCVCFGRLLSIR